MTDMPYNEKREWSVPFLLLIEELNVIIGSTQYLWVLRRGRLRRQWFGVTGLMVMTIVRRQITEAPYTPDVTAILINAILLCCTLSVVLSELTTFVVRGCLLQWARLSVLLGTVYLLVGMAVFAWPVDYFTYWSFEFLVILLCSMCAGSLMDRLIDDTKTVELIRINEAIDALDGRDSG